ncbi:MAG: Iron-sulfur cluster regulator IscR [uncultured Thiotrichaceae bacterium]|uniref:Iron-sulfur cluster regulator IscR n=1 Tax=uncultured Thiotrichaceae bacterium TaxID=298394 RepID=A0A6S6TR59_9GAMM|nr:MAG: Iron-sulfur cluster regulator IscR [uncultured Thiotrichaceae bacterium]
MKISSRGQYAIKAMLQLALHEHESPVSLVDISNVNNISVSYLEQLFSNLRKDDLIEGVRGPGGGYRLGKSSTSISIANILTAIEDGESKSSAVQNDELSMVLWEFFTGQLYDYLENITLHDLMDHPDVPKVEIARDTTAQYIASMFKPTAESTGHSFN